VSKRIVFSEAPMSSDPLWVVPAITASASLLGTMVGGLATYWTSKTSHDRATAAQEATQRYALLREAAMRFVAAMSEVPGPGSGLERLIRQWGSAADKLVAARTEEELVTAARAIDPSIEEGEGRVGVLISLVRGTGIYDEVVQRRFTLLTELRLIAPGDVADSAQRVLYRAFAQEVTGAIQPHLHREAIDAFNREINSFVNLVRHHMNVEDIEFEFINEKVMHNLLDMEG
jgi:hypothetical protein